MTSATTFEDQFRQRLLNLVYAQWATLGAPFSGRTDFDAHEVIDPEALLWCTLEFVPTEARLAETVLEWLGTNDVYVLRQRVHRRGARDDPRTMIWNALDPRPRRLTRTVSEPPVEPCHGLSSAAQVAEFIDRIAVQSTRGHSLGQRLGHLQAKPATLLLRARDLLGHDIRHFLLVYLLAHPHGGKLREVQAWSGYSYRSLFDAAARWVAVGAVTLDSGYCRLTAPESWRALLQIRTSEIITVNWGNVFEVTVRLLRDLAKARRNEIGEESPVYPALRRVAAEKLEAASPDHARASDLSVGPLVRLLRNAG